MSSNNQKDHTVLLSVDYHGEDEVMDHQDVTMTRKELRAVMVWISRLTVGSFPSDNCATGAHKIYSLLQRSNNSVTEAKQQLGSVIGGGSDL